MGMLDDISNRYGKVNHIDELPSTEAAQFDVTVTRTGANIAEVLPFPLFGAAALAAGLQGDIANYVASSSTSLVGLLFGTIFSQVTGEVLTIAANLSDAKKLQLEYKKGANQDYLTIQCSTAPYPQFVQSTFSDVFRLERIRMSISDTAQSSQFSNAITYQRKTIFGKEVKNNWNPSSFRRPDQFQSGIVDMDINLNVDKETSLWSSINASSGLVITYSLFVSRVSKFGAGAL